MSENKRVKGREGERERGRDRKERGRDKESGESSKGEEKSKKHL